MPRWYRRARQAGGWLLAGGAAGLLVTYPFVSGEPGSAAEAELADPAWTRLVAGVGTVAMVLGLALLLAPAVHRLTAGRRG